MTLYIIPYCIISNSLAHCSIKIALFPKRASSQLLFGILKFLENLTARNAFQNYNHSRKLISGQKRNQYAHIVFIYLTSVYFKIKITCNFIKKLSYPWANFINKDLFSILRTPHQMIFRFIYRMACSFQAHAVILWGTHLFLKHYGDSPNCNEERRISLFSSLAKGRAFKHIFRRRKQIRRKRHNSNLCVT